MSGLSHRCSPCSNIFYQKIMLQFASLTGVRSFPATLSYAPIEDPGPPLCAGATSMSGQEQPSDCLQNAPFPHRSFTPTRDHTSTHLKSRKISLRLKYTSSHYESPPRSLAQAPVNKTHPYRGLPLPNNPVSIIRLNFFVLFDYTDARPSLLPKLEDEKCPGVSFSNCTWAAWVICCHQIDARSENTSNEQTLNLNSGWLGRRRRHRQEAAILILSISFTVCHCF